ncbi:MAG: TrmB family transcriptional regulator [Candidatus Thermoplasmatota archaeon]|nr:TrmB family transcriptional regulator [Candidatus Thermoplasmatota archaeon]
MNERNVEMDELKEEYDLISSGLQRFGLTEYEARTYTALVAHGVADAETIASSADLPRTSVYKSLDSLHDMGYVVVSEGRPRVFKPADPLEIKSRLSRELDDTFGRLNTISEILTERGEPQLVYTINGKEKVLDKIGEMINRTDEKIILSSPNFSVILDSFQKELESAEKRGVDIAVVTTPRERVYENADIRRKERLIATDLISDGKRALLASPGFETCGYTNDPSLAKHLVDFMDVLMDRE